MLGPGLEGRLTPADPSRMVIWCSSSTKNLEQCHKKNTEEAEILCDEVHCRRRPSKTEGLLSREHRTAALREVTGKEEKEKQNFLH